MKDGGPASFVPASARKGLGVARARAKLTAAGDEDDLVRARFQLFVDVGEERVEPAGVADEPGERLARNRLRRGEDRRLGAQHPFAPAHPLRQVEEVAVETGGVGAAHRP